MLSRVPKKITKFLQILRSKMYVHTFYWCLSLFTESLGWAPIQIQTSIVMALTFFAMVLVMCVHETTPMQNGEIQRKVMAIVLALTAGRLSCTHMLYQRYSLFSIV